MKKTFVFVTLISLASAFGFSVKAQNIVSADAHASNIFERTHSQNRKPVDFPYVREADIVNAKYVWRRVDFKEPFNQFFYYPIEGSTATQGLESFPTIIWKALMNGDIVGYTNEDFTQEYDPAVLQRRFEKSRIDTSWIEDEDGFQQIKITPINQKFSSADVVRMDIFECWFVDKQRSVQDVRILGFALTRETYRTDEVTGERIPAGDEDICWVRYANDPAVRQLLVTKEVFNPKNDVDRRTFDDIFVQRYFNSFIYKESNVSQRSIGNYLVGMDALLQSDKIKEQLMNQEIDMWEY